MESDSDTARYLNISRENSASESMNREKERESVSLSHDKERHDHRRKAVPTKSDRRNWSATKATPTCTSQEKVIQQTHIASSRQTNRNLQIQSSPRVLSNGKHR